MWVFRCLILLVTSVVLATHALAKDVKVQGRAAAPRDFVLIHGAWVGEWYWQDLVDQLHDAGHRAVAVSLTGHGRRADEGGPHVSIDMHAEDVIRAVNEQGFEDVILVGHSYGGRPLTAAWDELRDNVTHVVYVEAVAPIGDGIIAIPQDSQSMRFVLQRYPAWVEMGEIPVPERLRQAYTQVLAPQSMRAAYGQVSLKHGTLPPTPGTYVVAEESRARIFLNYGKRLQELRGWSLRTISGGHNIRDKGFDDLLDVLLEIAKKR